MINEIHDTAHAPTPEAATEKKIPTQQKKRKRNKHDYQHWLADPYNTVRGETALWVAVITQAMMDALSHSRNPEIIVHKHEAIRWLTGDSKHFRTVCHYADIDPDYVRKKAKRCIANPPQWRAEAGKGERYEERKTYRQKIKPSQKINEPEHISSHIITGCWE